MKNNYPGIGITKVSLLRLNKVHTRNNGKPLFIPLDCTKEVLDLQKNIEKNIKHIIKVSGQPDEPDEALGLRCESPHVCNYIGWCYGKLPKDNVFDIGWNLADKKKFEAFNNGIITFQDILNSGIKLSEKANRQVTTTVNNSEPFVDKQKIYDFLYNNAIRFPLYYLDFEWAMEPIPQYDDIRPYENALFQYSIHLQEKRCDPLEKLKHMEFLGTPGLDPRRALAAQLCADIPKGSCIVSYSASNAEKPRLRELAKLFPDLSAHLLDIEQNTVDLAEPFQKGYYYCKEMGGKYSIKVVSSALFPDDEDLSYEDLEIVQYGGVMRIYSRMFKEHTLEDVSKKIEALREYCKKDTLEMVKIVNKLHELVK